MEELFEFLLEFRGPMPKTDLGSSTRVWLEVEPVSGIVQGLYRIPEAMVRVVFVFVSKV